MVEREDEQRAHAILSQIEVEMRKRGFVSTAHIDFGVPILAAVLAEERQKRDRRETEERQKRARTAEILLPPKGTL